MEKTITEACQFLDIKQPHIESFDWPEIWITKSTLYIRGVYIIRDNITNNIFYVGKGNVRERLLLHARKIYGMQDGSSSWWNYIESQEHEVKPGNWHVTYITCNSETEMSALESILVHKLKPLANDDVRLDTNINETKKTIWSKCHTVAYYQYKRESKKSVLSVSSH